MDNISTDKTNDVSDRISAIVKHLIDTKSLFKDLDPLETSQIQTEDLLEIWSPEQAMDIPDDELISIINDIMAFKAISGLIADFTPEEMEIFDAAVEGR